MSYHIVPARVTLRTSPMKDTFGDLFCAALKTFRFITDWHRKITARNLKTAKRNRGVTRASDPEPQQKKGPDTLSSYPILLPYPPTLPSYPTLLPYPPTLPSYPTLLPYPPTLSSYPTLLRYPASHVKNYIYL